MTSQELLYLWHEKEQEVWSKTASVEELIALHDEYMAAFEREWKTGDLTQPAAVYVGWFGEPSRWHNEALGD